MFIIGVVITLGRRVTYLHLLAKSGNCGWHDTAFAYCDSSLFYS